MPSQLLDIQAGAVPYVGSVEQIIGALKGNLDITQISAFQQIVPPSSAVTTQVLSTSGNLTGAYQYAVAFVTGFWSINQQNGLGQLIAAGNTGGGQASNTVSPSGNQVQLNNIPVGPNGTVARILYRTKANGTGFFFLYQINDNVTTSWIDNTADAALGASMPTVNTTGTKFTGDGSGLNPATSTTAGVVKAGSGVNVGSDGTISVTPASIGAIASSFEGVANGVATLDAAGHLPVAQLPSAIPAANLPIATAAALGLVKLGSGIDVDVNGVISSHLVTSGGTIGGPLIVAGGLTLNSFTAANTAEVDFNLDGNTGGAGANSQKYYWARTPSIASATPKQDFGLWVYDGSVYNSPLAFDYTDKEVRIGGNSGWNVKTLNNTLDDGSTGIATFASSVYATSYQIGGHNTIGMQWNNPGNQLYWIGGTGGYYWANAANNATLMSLDNSGNMTVTGKIVTESMQSSFAVGTSNAPSVDGFIQFVSNGLAGSDGAFLEYWPPTAAHTTNNTANNLTIASANNNPLSQLTLNANTVAVGGNMTITGNLTVNGGGIMKPRQAKMVTGSLGGTATTVLNISGVAGRIIAIRGGGAGSSVTITTQITIDGTQIMNAGMGTNAGAYSQISAAGETADAALVDVQFKNSASVVLTGASSYTTTYWVVYETE